MKNIALLCFLMFSLAATGQKIDRKLQTQIETLVTGFHGTVGIYVQDLKTGRIAELNADTLFPTASVVKIPIMIGIMNRIRLGELTFHQPITYVDTINYDPGEDVLASFRPNEKILLSKLLLLSLSLSDNNASLLLQGLAGGGARINGVLDSLGYTVTRVNSRTPGRQALREVYGWGVTSPREISKIMLQIEEGRLFSVDLSERMLRTLGREYWDEEAMSSIPPNVFVATKSGAVDQTRNEVLYVNAPHPYLFSIFTKNNTDTTWQKSNEAWVLTRKLSSMLFEYYNPHYVWGNKEW